MINGISKFTPFPWYVRRLTFPNWFVITTGSSTNNSKTISSFHHYASAIDRFGDEEEEKERRVLTSKENKTAHLLTPSPKVYAAAAAAAALSLSFNTHKKRKGKRLVSYLDMATMDGWMDGMGRTCFALLAGPGINEFLSCQGERERAEINQLGRLVRSPADRILSAVCMLSDS